MSLGDDSEVTTVQESICSESCKSLISQKDNFNIQNKDTVQLETKPTVNDNDTPQNGQQPGESSTKTLWH